MRRQLRRGVLAAAPWPLVYACSKRELARAYPRQTAVRALYLVLYAAAIVACAVFVPWLLVPFGIAAIAGALTGLWLMRPDAGRRDGLPPGALSLIPVRQFTDEQFLTRQIQRHGPVSKTTWPTLSSSPIVCVHGLRRGGNLLREHGPRLAGVGIAFDPLIPARFLRNMEPGDHRHYKRIFEKAFSDSVVEARRDDFGAAVEDGLQALAAASRKPGGADPRAYIQRMTLAALAPLFLGVEPATQDYDRLVEIYEAMGEYVEPRSVDCAEGCWLQEAVRELEQILRRSASEIAAAFSSGRYPAPSFLEEVVRAQPDALDDPNVTLNLAFLLRTGSSDVSSLLHWVMKTLGDHPEWSLRSRDAGASDVPSRVVLETLRLHQSEFLQRRVLESFEVDGFTVPEGWYLRLCVHECHRDPAVFADPDAFDPDRFVGRRLSRYEYSPFGRLEHRCIGVSTTISLATCFVARLSDEYDWAVVGDGPPEFDGYHWRPSRKFRVCLEPRAQAVIQSVGDGE